MAGSRRSLSRCAAVSWQRFIRPVTNGGPAGSIRHLRAAQCRTKQSHHGELVLTGCT
jgi:hypothetical protein